ncbi:hypothetical protein EPA93_10675 [Ktedonosporobacter rubrisoli]|uniref:HTH luxR-type domain-containing protein n=1 Tax=Ktedonosporobacter rubrisoli TaxID=2509675 RepID=A0A4P6JMH1_KTERU|nr:LuxR C-terminal-related transcriptional regulator [Ktedonosporobacter rubrisoli]QBD76449.1 hypothetical protein EPA93_10675 [Ktedonosporobacter rubrisoli]
MPRHTTYLLSWLPETHTYAIYVEGQPSSSLPLPDSQAWFSWLESITSFSFHGKCGKAYTVRKEKVQNRGAYWYGYRRFQGRITKRYIGRSTDLTTERLEEIATLLPGHPKDASASSLAIENRAQEDTSEPLETPLNTSVQPGQLTVLASKLHPPRLARSLIARPHLLVSLDEALAYNVILLCAPAGSGKTTLVSQWIASHDTDEDFPAVAWLSLDAGDNDPLRFWHYIIAACQSLQAPTEKSMPSPLELLFQPPFKLLSLEKMLTSFLNELGRSALSGLLVLEDYHVITSPQIHESFSFFLDHRPEKLRFMLLSRSEPPMQLARLRANGFLYELQTSELRFSRQETSTFLAQTVAQSLSEEALNQLDSRIEGWAAGLRLLALSWQRQKSQRTLEQALANLSGQHRPIQDYFVSEVLNAQPEPLQQFILQTSILTRLHSSLCAAITGRQDSEALLDALERDGLFLESIEGPEPWYRYHALFAEAMRVEARRRLGEEALQNLFRLASRWYETHAMLTEAVEAALASQDTEYMVEQLERFLLHIARFSPGALPSMQELHTLLRWLGMLPEALICAHPMFSFSYAVALLLSLIMQPQQPSPEYIDRLEKYLQMAEDGWQREGDTAQLGAVYTIRALLSVYFGTLDRTLNYSRQALTLLPSEEHSLRYSSLHLRSMGELLAGHINEANRLLLEAHTFHRAPEHHAFLRANRVLWSRISFEQGKLHQAAEHYQQVLAEARQQNDNDDICDALLGLSQISYEWNELATAEQQALEALECGQQLAVTHLIATARLILATIEHARGATTQALQSCNDLLTYLSMAIPARWPMLSLLSRATHTLQAELLLASGNLPALESLWGSHLKEETTRSASAALIVTDQQAEFMLPQQEREEFFMARWLLAKEKPQEALVILERLQASARADGRKRQELETQVLMALVYAAEKQAARAREMLYTVLACTYTEGYQRLFLNEGEAMANLLQSILPSVHESTLLTYIRRLLHAFAQERNHPGAPAPGSQLIDQLSTQEQRVLRLLSAGRSNPEIAAELVVTVNTVKAHVQSIYRKLLVNNRVEASEVARLLDLI